MIKQTALALVLAFGSSSIHAGNAAYIRFPTLQGDQAVVTAEGDLWSVPLAGGQATRLTTHPGQETHAAYSPDGRWLAFTATYEGSPEAYLMPVAGGQPKRLTFSGERSTVLGFTNTGQVLFTMRHSQGMDGQRVVAMIDPLTLKQTVFPLANANDAVLSDDGKTLFFIRHGLATTGDNARFYQGGTTAAIWRYEVGRSQEATRLSGDIHSSDRRPMLWQGRLYFVSNRSGRDNLWSMTPNGKDLRQHTQHRDFDIRHANLSHGKIAYQLGADLHVIDLASQYDRTVPVTLTSDFDQRRDRLIRAPLSFAGHLSFAPSGDKVVLNARGQIAVTHQGTQRRVQIALPAGSRASQSILSPDGKWVYAICDASGEQEIWRFPADGSSGGKALTNDGKLMRVSLKLSPDGNWLAHSDKAGVLWLLNLATGKNEHIDQSNIAEYGEIAFSPDNQFLALTRPNSSIGRNQLLLMRLTDHKLQVLTSDRYESGSPAFSPDGKWLYFLSDRHFQSSSPAPWGDRNTGAFFDRRAKVYALALQTGLRFPYAAKTELDTPVTPAKPAGTGKEKPSTDKPAPLQWSGLASRLFEVPLSAGNYTHLKTDGKRLFFTDHEAGSDGKTTLKSLAIDDQSPEPEVFASDIQGYALSGDGKKLLFSRGPKDTIGDLFIVDAAPKPPNELAKAQVKTADWSILVKPADEWRQMFADAWRMQRDFFYDAQLRGVDWQAVHRRYEPLVDRINDRSELNDLLAQMVAELGTLHSQIGTGDQRQATDGRTAAFLGAVLVREPNGVRIQHIYRTDPELPTERAPLAQPGVDARTGDLIIAVNGLAVGQARDIADLLSNRAEQQVLLTLRRGQAEHQVVVTPVQQARHAQLRYSDWQESRRAIVDQASNGKIGYLHLKAMGEADMADFVRQFYAQIDREGLIIDIRNNEGGNVDSWIVEKLLRRVWGFWQPRHGNIASTHMQQTFRGHLAVLIDENTYSDGETFAAAVKALKLGPLIGKRTSGAGVWLTDYNKLLDNGIARAAEFAQFSAQTGEWLIEGKGVMPDQEVDNPPHATFQGQDAQLNAAIGLLQDKLKAMPISPLRPQPIPPLPH